MPTYHAKSETVEAYRLMPTPESQTEIINWAHGPVSWGPGDALWVATPDGQMIARVGDYIVWHCDADEIKFSVMDHDEFLEKYEAD